MKTQSTSLLLWLFLIGFFGISPAWAAPVPQINLAKGFAAPPDSAAPRTWWHWMNGNVTKEGITADLESMQRVGIRAATIVVMADGPDGPVRFRSPLFYEMVKFAASEGKRLGIAVGLENCSGWSSSGGPWVTPENSMQTVVTSDEIVTGPFAFSETLPQPKAREGFYRDIRVLAFPALEGDVPMASLSPKITSSAADFRDPSNPGGYRLPQAKPEQPQYLQFKFAQPLAARTLLIDFSRVDSGTGKIEASDDGQNFRTLSMFHIRTKSGMQAYALKPEPARYYRVVFMDRTTPGDATLIPSIDFLAAPRLDNWLAKCAGTEQQHMAGNEFDTTNTPLPPENMVIHTGQVIDLTSKVDATGKLIWNVPPGKWTVLRVGHTTTGAVNHPGPKEGIGLECDKLSRPAAKAFWAGLMEKVTSDLGPLIGTSFTHTLIDSYEVGNQNWTPQFAEEFQRRCGYSLIPYLPIYSGRIVESPAVTERVLWDIRRTIADLFAENYFDYFTVLSHQSGITLESEPYGNGPFDALRSGRDADRVMGEFWWPSGDLGTIKLAASIGHTYGKSIVGAEAFTSRGSTWIMHPANMKALGDLAFTIGINAYTFHRFAMQPWTNRWPGMTMGMNGSNLERTNTWWEQGKAWMQYLERSQYLLQQGRFVGDALFFVGEGSSSSAVRPTKQILSDGYDFDSCNADIILNRLTVKDGNLLLPDGTTYRVLVLPSAKAMTPALLRKLKELANAGAVILGPKPNESPSLSDYPKCDAEVSKLAADLWENGKIISNKQLPEVFASLNLQPDFQTSNPAMKFPFIHRRIGQDDLYFISNQDESVQQIDCFFRISGKTPELWHPDTGKIEKALVWSEEGGRTRIPMHLDPAGSMFVLFHNTPPPANHPVSLARVDAESAVSTATLEIKKAIYGAAAGKEADDVTAKVSSLVQNGMLHLGVATPVFGKDPAPNKIKKLWVDYVLNGQPGSKSAEENASLNISAPQPLFPEARLFLNSSGAACLEAWQPGTYAVKMADGKTMSIPVAGLAQPTEITGPWMLKFPPNWGAPEKVTLEKLVSWPEFSDPGVKYFSGTATYEKTFLVSKQMLGAGHHLYLDLGDVQVIARVKWNKKDLGILWKPPYAVEITGAAQPGQNSLEVEVTNLWPNRIIGDEQLPEDSPRWSNGLLKGAFPQWLADGKPSPTGRFTFTNYRYYKKTDSLLPSGLIGPVFLRSSLQVPLP